MLITGMEIYRRGIINSKSRMPLALLIITGSLLIAIVGISISPVGPALFSRGALQLIAANLILGAVVGVAASYRPN